MSCLLCDDTGLICGICGESEKACECTLAEVAEHEARTGNTQFDECPECT